MCCFFLAVAGPPTQKCFSMSQQNSTGVTGRREQTKGLAIVKAEINLNEGYSQIQMLNVTRYQDLNPNNV